MSTFGGVAYAGEAYIGAPAAPAPAGVNSIEFLLYDAINANFLGLLDATTGRKWHDPHNDAGAGEFDIHADHPLALSALTDANGDAVYDNVVRCRLNGAVRYAFIIKENKKSTAKADEEVGRLLHIAGPGTLAYFRESVVYPERGIGRESPDNRLFNWTAFSFNDTAWPAASEKATYGTPIPGSAWNGLYGILPRDFPDLTAKWIWGTSGSATSDSLPGDAYFRKLFTLTSTISLKAAFTGDNGLELFIDNAFITGKAGHNSAWTQAAAVDLLLDQGPHLIAIKVHNLSKSEAGIGPGSLNPGGLLFALHLNAFGSAPDGGDFGTMVMHSDNSWKVLQYPPGGPPGMTPGEVLRVLFTEAQARGAMPGVTWTFTDANDSAGSPWAVTPDFGVQVGTTYEAMLRQLAEVACDLHMDPDSMRIDVFNQRGTARSTTLTIAGNITDLEHQGTGDVVNAAILRHATGWRESLLGSSITAHGRHEGFLSLGTAPSTEQGDLAAQSLFLETGNPRDAIVVTHEGAPGSGSQPYADFDVADTVTAPARDGQAKTQSVKAITVAEDAEGNPIFTPELQALSDAFDARIQRWIKRMSSGTVSGQSENASPFVASSSQKEKVPPPETLAQTTFRYATVVVAASNSFHTDAADYLCTGTNDHTMLNTAIADAAGAGGGKVLLMEGTYNCPGQISLPSTVILQGMGDGTVLSIPAGTNGDFDVIRMSAASTNNGVTDLTINGAGQTSGKQYGIHFQPASGFSGGQQSIIYNVRFTGLRAAGIWVTSSALNTGYGVVIDSCWFESIGVSGSAFATSGACGVFVEGEDGTIIVNCTFHDLINSGVRVHLCSDVTIANCNFYRCPRESVSGVEEAGITLETVSRVTVVGNHVVECRHFMDCLGANACVITGNQFSSNNLGAGRGVLFNGLNAGNVFSNNVLTNVFGHGLELRVTSDRNAIQDNYFAMLPNAADLTYDGIHIAVSGGSDENNIQGNKIFNNAFGSGANRTRYGIRIEAGNTGNLVTNNDLLKSGTTASLSDAGTGTVTAAGNRL